MKKGYVLSKVAPLAHVIFSSHFEYTADGIPQLVFPLAFPLEKAGSFVSFDGRFPFSANLRLIIMSMFCVDWFSYSSLAFFLSAFDNVSCVKIFNYVF